MSARGLTLVVSSQAMQGSSMNKSTEESIGAAVGMLTAAADANGLPVLLVEVVDSRRSHQQPASRLDDAAVAFTAAVDRVGVPLMPLNAEYAGGKSAALVVLRFDQHGHTPYDLDGLTRTIRTSRKTDRLIVIVHPSDLPASAREALSRWQSFGAMAGQWQ